MPRKGTKYQVKILDDKQKKWALEKRNDGYTMKEIAAALFVSYATMIEFFKWYPKPTPRPPLVYNFEEV